MFERECGGKRKIGFGGCESLGMEKKKGFEAFGGKHLKEWWC